MSVITGSHLKTAVGAFLTATVCFATGAGAQETGTIPSPSEFHGYDLGSRYTITSALYDYYQMLAERSPRVAYRSYGTTIQGRDLPMLIVGSEENIQRLDAIKKNLQEITENTTPLPDEELQSLISETPTVVWPFIVDTDEEAGVEVMQEIVYELATEDSERANTVRDDVLLITTPLTNPDAHTRYVTWHKKYNVDGAAVDPYAIENEAHWGANTDGNAWGVDVNRDFGWFVTPEMQALGDVATDWHPQFWLDVHSGPNVLFMPPFPRPYHPLWPEQAPKWWRTFSQQANQAFGDRGWSYYSREGYEGVTHVGFALSWGMLGPANAGYLFESFGGRPGKTTAFIRSDGTKATLRMAMDRHKLGIWTMLEVARDNHDELLRDAHDRVIRSVRKAEDNSVRTVILPRKEGGRNSDKLVRLVNRLELQGVEVRRVDEPFTTSARNFLSLDIQEPREFREGSYVVDLTQPQARLARSLLDPTIDYSEPTINVGDPFSRNMPYYDVAWGNLPYLFGVDAYATEQDIQVESSAVDSASTGSGRVVGLDMGGEPYAWILPADREANYRAAVQLMEDGYRVRVFHGQTEVQGDMYPKGTMALIRGRNPADVGSKISEVVNAQGGLALAVAGPYTERGVTFGDDQRLAAIPDPKIAVLADWPVWQDHIYGGIRSVLEGDFSIAFTPVMRETLNERDLDKYTTVVLPHAGMAMRGGPNFEQGYEGKLNLENLRSYVEKGGTLVAVKGASEVVATDSVLGHGVNFKGWSQWTAGSALRAEWNTGLLSDSAVVYWEQGIRETRLPLLSAGYSRQEFAAPAAYPVLLEVPDGSNAEVVARYSTDGEQNILLDGFSLEQDRKLLRGQPFVVIQPVGDGRVIYFADSTTFRGYWYGMNQLFVNSLLFGPTL